MTITRVSDAPRIDARRTDDTAHLAADVIERRLAEVRRRQTGVRLAMGALTTAAILLAVMMLAMLVDARMQLLSTTARAGLTYATLSVVGLAFLWLVGRPLSRRRTFVDVARDIERDLPTLEERWSSVESLSRSTDIDEVRGSEAMIRQVTREAVDLEPLVQSEQLVSTRGIRQPAIALGALLAVMFLALLVDFPRVSVLLRRFWSPASPISLTQIEALPGDTLVAVGEPLRLQAKLSSRPVDGATIMIRGNDGATESLDMRPTDVSSTDGPGSNDTEDNDTEDTDRTDEAASQTFDHRIRAVGDSFGYRIRAGDGQTAWYQVTVAQRPRITEMRLQITPPTYTGREVTVHEELPRHVRVVEGSTLHFSLRADMPLSQSQLRLGDDESIKLTSDADGWYHGELPATETMRLVPHVVSEQGLPNGRTAACRVTVFKDRAPSVELVAPEVDFSVRPDDTVNIEFEARDDFGITGAELIVRKVGGDPSEPDSVTTIPIPLADQEGTGSVEQTVALDLSQFKLEQGEQLDYAIRVFDSKNLSAESDQPRAGELAQMASRAAIPGDSPPSDQVAAAAAVGPDDTLSRAAPSDEQTPNASPAPNEAQAPGEAQPAPDDAAPAPSPSDVADSQPSSPSSDRQAKNSPSQSGQPSGQPSASPPGEQKPQGELAGTPRPADEMTRRSLDVRQNTTSSSLRLTIDEWAGSFEGQARLKLQLAIEPYIIQLQEDLEHAQQHTTTLTTALADSGKWGDAEIETLDHAHDRLKSAIDTIDQLQAKTTETPYAFIGLQLVDIGQSHVGPAFAMLLDETDADRKATARHENIDQSRHHIVRARELLAALLQQYEEVKRNERVAEQMQLIKTMYEVFIEDTMDMLRQQSENLNPKERKVAEFELDQQYLDGLRAQLEKRRELQAELARILAEDPRLLRRLMAIAAERTSSLRDQMTRLAWQQEAVLVNFQRWQSAEYLEPPRDAAVVAASAEVAAGADGKTIAPGDKDADGSNDETANQEAAARETAKMQRILAVGDWDTLSREAASLHENFITWSPLDLGDSASLKNNGEAARLIAVAASGVRDTAAAGRYEQTLDETRQLYEAIEKFETELPRLVDEHPGHQGVAVHVTNRLVEATKIAASARDAYRKVQWMHRGRAYRVAEVDQQRVTAETGELASKLEGLETLLPPQVSAEVRELAKQVEAVVNDELQVHQISALYALREEHDNSVDKLQQSIDSFAKAERLFDELIDKAIEELDQLPVGNPTLGDDPTLDELLALLENELNDADPLGIPGRPNNLRIRFDWLRPGDMTGMMAGAAAQGQAAQTKTAAEKIQESAEERARALARRDASGDESSDDVAAPVDVRWNTLVSQLEDGLRQGRGTLPPQQYRRAIEQYFKMIAGRRQQND